MKQEIDGTSSKFSLRFSPCGRGQAFQKVQFIEDAVIIISGFPIQEEVERKGQAHALSIWLFADGFFLDGSDFIGRQRDLWHPLFFHDVAA
jgi:hypothetical protein